MKRLLVLLVAVLLLIVFANLIHFLDPALVSVFTKAKRKAEPIYSKIPSAVKQARSKKCKCCKLNPELSEIVHKHLTDKRNPSSRTPSTSK